MKKVDKCSYREYLPCKSPYAVRFMLPDSWYYVDFDNLQDAEYFAGRISTLFKTELFQRSYRLYRCQF